MIAITNYGLGNLHAFVTIYRRLNIEVSVVSEPNGFEQADAIILPGVGSFDHAMDCLNSSGMREALEARVLGHNIPLLGICVGMQMLAATSEEGERPGLGWVPGRVIRIPDANLPFATKLPHMGWNTLLDMKPSPLFEGLEPDPRFYFLHSYCFDTEADDCEARVEYGSRLACAVRHGNVFGVQFHPEKSHHCGVRLLQNFAKYGEKVRGAGGTNGSAGDRPTSCEED